MPRLQPLSGNVGEWSEIYVFLQLLGMGRLYAADADLRKLEDTYFEVRSIIRDEPDGKRVFRIVGPNSIEMTGRGLARLNREQAEFRRMAAKVLKTIQAKRGSKNGAFSDLVADSFLESIDVNRLKASSRDKADIRVEVHDINTGYNAVQGFSIKSRLGSPSTLLNASKHTNFQFDVIGPVDDELIEAFNSTGRFEHKARMLKDCGLSLKFSHCVSETFGCNLLLIDDALPEIVGELLRISFWEQEKSLDSCISHLATEDPCGYRQRGFADAENVYRVKVKRLLYSVALGMVPATPWFGDLDATGGYVIVREDGEVLCFHLFNRNQFEGYLLSNMKFDTPSTSRNHFGHLVRSTDGTCHLLLNLQLRFKR